MMSQVAMLPTFAIAQKTNSSINKTALTNTEKAFVQDAINKNNEAMALAQAALNQSQKKDVQLIAGQILNDHRAAQKKLYTIANITDTVPYSRSATPATADNTKLPLADNLDTRRTRVISSISSDDNKTTTTANNTNNTSNNTTAGTANTQLHQNGSDTASRFGVNQQFNGNTSIDNANGVNNSNRTDVGSYSGRASETNTVANSQNPVMNNQQVTNNTTNSTSTNTGTISTTNNLPNTPNFPNRVTDTVRQAGSTTGFQNPGTNLSFPGNERYSTTTPATTPNNNAGSDYGVNGVVVNNAQTNNLNTAPYSNNNINSNQVQTGRVLPTSNPAAVINSSTASMGNKDVGFNNANTGNNGNIQQSGQLTADNANGVNRRTSEVINNNKTTNNTTRNSTIVNNNTINNAPATNTNNGAIVAGRTRGNRTVTNTTTQMQTSSNTSAGNFYSTPFAASEGMNILRNTQANNFDAQWAIQINNNQQAAVTTYQTALRRTTNAQVRTYINTILPLLRGHQFALTQWQAKQ